MGIVFVASERDVVGDMEEEESGEVVVEEDSIIMTSPIGKEEARWTKMSTVGGEVATMAYEVGGGATSSGGSRWGIWLINLHFLSLME